MQKEHGMSENRKRILHVDDDREIQKFIGVILSNLGDITPIETLQAARAAIRNTRFDLVLLDFTLPDGSGSELIHEMATQDPSIPIVVFSGHEIANTMQNVKATFLKARFSRQKLVDTVKALLSK
jgi:DNA-binding NtrC family response regulator